MELKIDISDELIEKTVVEIFNNFPEYANYVATDIRCVSYNYDPFKFVFIEEDDWMDATKTEDEKKECMFVIKKDNAVQGFKKYLEAHWGKYPDKDLLDAGEYDSPMTMDVLQYCIYGEIIFG